MKKLVLKLFIYAFLILIMLELIVRVFHLSKDTPSRYVDEYEVEKWVPNQNGFSVTGNRKQNFSEYRINKFGYNSYREFTPTKNKVEIALVGDSFIEGFHQPYHNSIGKKIENEIPEIEVYEYGYAGYDFADQLHLINAYKADFELIDHVFLGIKFNNDLNRDRYAIITERLALESPFNKFLKKSKLLVYSRSIGVLDSPLHLASSFINFFKTSRKKSSRSGEKSTDLQKKKENLENFKKLVATYGYDKNRFTLLLDASITPEVFITYLRKNNYDYIDFHKTFKKSKKPTTLIYDRHWNNHGRTLIAQLISDYTKEKIIQN